MAYSSVICVMSCCGRGSTVSFRQVARDGGVEGMSRGKAASIRKGLMTYLVLRLPMAESCTFFAETLPCGLAQATPSQLLVHTMISVVQLLRQAPGPVPTKYGEYQRSSVCMIFLATRRRHCCLAHVTGKAPDKPNTPC